MRWNRSRFGAVWEPKLTVPAAPRRARDKLQPLQQVQAILDSLRERIATHSVPTREQVGPAHAHGQRVALSATRARSDPPMWGRVATYVAIALVLGSFLIAAIATPLGIVLLVLGPLALLFAVLDWLRNLREPAELKDVVMRLRVGHS